MASTPEVISRLDRDREAIWRQFTNGSLTANEATLRLLTLDVEVRQGSATGDERRVATRDSVWQSRHR